MGQVEWLCHSDECIGLLLCRLFSGLQAMDVMCMCYNLVRQHFGQVRCGRQMGWGNDVVIVIEAV